MFFLFVQSFSVRMVQKQNAVRIFVYMLKTMKKTILAGMLLLAALPLFAQKNPVTLRVGFYNLENLFDTINDPKINDEEFLPQGKNKWNSERYTKKLNNLAKVILEMNGGKGMDVLGVCEIENRRVLEDLTRKTALKKVKYDIVHYDSPDGRGIDVGLIYNKKVMRVLKTSKVLVKQPSDTLPPTRNIMVVKAILGKTDTVYFFVNHWPSRRGSSDNSERRVFAAKTLEQAIDSVRKESKNAQLIVMGDFNDTPSDKSIEQLMEESTLLNLMTLEKKMGNGSHYYKKEKNIFDQLMVSESLLQEKGFYVQPDGGRIFQPDWLLGEVYKGDGPAPLRTFAGSRYLGWYSDHLPVYVDLVLKTK